MRVEILLERSANVIVHEDVVEDEYGKTGQLYRCATRDAKYTYVLRNVTSIKVTGWR